MRANVDACVSFPLYILAKDCGEIKRYDGIDELSDLEAIDVRNGEYEGWDASGWVLQLSTTEDGWFSMGAISVGATGEVLSPEVLNSLRSNAKK